MNIYVCFIFFVTGGFWVLTLGVQKILSKKEAAVLFRKLTKYENFGTFQWCLGKCIYIYTCLGICMLSNMYLHVRSELYIHNIYIYACM